MFVHFSFRYQILVLAAFVGLAVLISLPQAQAAETAACGAPENSACDNVEIDSYESQAELHTAFLPTVSNRSCGDFFDDFSNPNSGWAVGEDDTVKSAYSSGEYQVLSKSADLLYTFAAPSCDREDFIVEVDARWVSVRGLAIGLFFGANNDLDQYYLFAINVFQRQYWLNYRGPSGWEAVIDVKHDPIIKTQDGTNHLKVTRDGDKIKLQINGKTVEEFTDDRIDKPEAASLLFPGLIAGTLMRALIISFFDP